MKFLRPIKLTQEQMKVANLPLVGERLIKGSAGSGKTTVAIYRLMTVAKTIRDDKRRTGDTSPVICRIVTYNNTLRSYVEALVNNEKISLGNSAEIVIHISTFDKWAYDTCSPRSLFFLTDSKNMSGHGAGAKATVLNSRNKHGLTSLDLEFVLAEITYVLGKYSPDQLNDYLTTDRVGRGASPRVDKKLMLEVAKDYINWKTENQKIDGDDLSVMMQNHPTPQAHDVIIVDESQDMTANKMRAIKHFLKPKVGSLTLVYDSAQQIYRHGYTWKEVGINVAGGDRTVALTRNYRNSREIALYVNSVLQNADLGQDGVAPDPAVCPETGLTPIVLKGLYPQQVDWAMKHLRKNVDLANETVAFLHPNKWFRDLKPKLSSNNFEFVELSGAKEWPDNDANIALLSMSSAKGLEFDHVYILGLDNDLTPCANEKDDDDRNWLIRLFAVACSRARRTLVIGGLSENPSFLIALPAKDTYTEIKL